MILNRGPCTGRSQKLISNRGRTPITSIVGISAFGPAVLLIDFTAKAMHVICRYFCVSQEYEWIRFANMRDIFRHFQKLYVIPRQKTEFERR